MMRRFKKLITVLLVAAMVLTPVMSVYAEGSEEVAEAIEEVAEEVEEAVEPAEGGETEEIAKPAEEIEEAIEPAEEIEEAVGEVEEEAVGAPDWTASSSVVKYKSALKNNNIYYQLNLATKSITYQKFTDRWGNEYYGFDSPESITKTAPEEDQEYRFYGWYANNELVDDGSETLNITTIRKTISVNSNKWPYSKDKYIYRYDDENLEFEARYAIADDFKTVSFVDIRTNELVASQSIVKGEKAIEGDAKKKIKAKDSNKVPRAFYKDKYGEEEIEDEDWPTIEDDTTIYFQSGKDIKVTYKTEPDAITLATPSYEWIRKNQGGDLTGKEALATTSDGYQFLYWLTDKNYRVFDNKIANTSRAYSTSAERKDQILPWEIPHDIQFQNNDRTFTAVYTTKKWVTFESDPDVSADYEKYRLVECGKPISNIPNPTNKEYTFRGWYTSENLAEDSKWVETKLVTENITLYPKWEKKAVINFCIPGQAAYYIGYTDKHATISDAVLDYANSPYLHKQYGYRVVAYCIDPERANEFDVANTLIEKEEITLYVVLKRDDDAKSTLQYKAGEGGKVSNGYDNVKTIVTVKGDDLAIGAEAIPNNGYRFLYWKVGDEVVETSRMLKPDRVEDTEFDDQGNRHYVYIYPDATYTAYFEIIPAPAPTPSGGGGGTVKSAQPAGTVQGNWAYNAATDKWTFASNDGRTYHNEWANVYNPYATGTQPKASWYFFDANNIMLTGYQWIPSLAGGYRLFYLHESNDGDRGRMYVNEATPNGGFADANGWVSINGVLQVK